MPDDRRAIRRRLPTPSLRVAASIALAVPVIGLVYAESAARRIGRPALLVAAMMVGTATVSAVSTTTGAQPVASPTPLAASAFRVLAPDAATREQSPSVVPPPTVVPPPASAAPTTAAPLPTPMPEAPTVIRFRPRDGWTGISRFADLSVRFSKPMDHASTEGAFDVAIAGKSVTGTARWAEDDTVLVLDPTRPLPYRARVTLSVGRGARSTEGVALRASKSVTFTVRSRPAATPRPTSAPTPSATPARTGWRWPLIGRITQRFGESLTKYGFHQGIDIDGDTGDRVRAALGGRVVLAGTADACGGLQVRIDHGNGVESWYRHLSRIETSRGQQVAAGAVIGRVGNTGCSLGSHLHFGIRRDGTFVDPLRYLPQR